MKVAALRALGAALSLLAVPASPASAAGTGQPDPTFGIGGVAVVSGLTAPAAVASLPGEALLVAGRASGDGAFATLGSGGAVTGVRASGPDPSRDNTVAAIAPAPDGKVVVAVTTVESGAPEMTVARLLPDGALDPSFNHRGYAEVAYPHGVEVTAVAVAADATVVIGGLTGTDVDATRADRGDFVLARFTASGVLDTTFGNAGEDIVSLGRPTTGIRAIVFGPGGTILATGAVGDGATDFGVVRLRANGDPDPGFGNGGIVVRDLGGDDRPYALAVTAAGSVAAAGAHDAGLGIARWTSTGTPDGATTAPFAPGGEIRDATFLADGRVLVAGAAGHSPAFGRYSAAGSLDPAFGDGGITTVLVASGAVADRQLVTASGAVVGVGPTGNGGTAVIRLVADVPALGGGPSPAGSTTLSPAGGGQAGAPSARPRAACVAFGATVRPRTVAILGTGWRPGARTVALRFAGRREWQTVTVRADGSFAAAVRAPFAFRPFIDGFERDPAAWSTPGRVFPTARLTVRDPAGARVPVTVVVRFVHTSLVFPFGRAPSARLPLHIAGLPAGRRAYLRAYRNGVLRYSTALGTTRGPCGTLIARHALLPSGAAPGAWMIDVSARRSSPRRFASRALGQEYARRVVVRRRGHALAVLAQ